MNRRLGLPFALALVVFSGAIRSLCDEPSVPHFQATDRRAEYNGPGREEPEPADVAEVRIGYYGPTEPSHPLGGDMWLAAGLAVEEANREGGYRGRPFRLVPAWSDNPWGSGVAQLARMVYDDGVWAIVGSIDGATTHLAEQVVAKARLTLINPAGTDKSVNMANVAWAFSCLPDDELQARVLWRLLTDDAAEASFVLVSSTAHDWHHAASALTEHASRHGVSPLLQLEFAPGTGEFAEIADRVTGAGATAAVVLAGPQDAARLVKRLRGQGSDLLIVGGHSMGRRVFIESAGADADGVVFPLPCDPGFLASPFSERFLGRFGHRPDCTAAQTYDATRILVGAISRAGLNRAGIRDAVAELPPWEGVAGSIDWGPLGRNRRQVVPAGIRDGEIVPLTRD